MSAFPNLIVPGAAKSGTSSLFEYLSRHPEIQASSRKEPQIFTYVREPEARQRAFEKLYGSGPATRFRLDASTSYLISPVATARMTADLTDPHFIVLLRNPVDRIVSHYRWMRGLGTEWRPLREAVERDREHVFTFDRHLNGNFRYYFDYSRYGSQVARLAGAFGMHRILVLTTETLRSAPDDALASCTDFLGLDRLPPTQPIMANRTSETRWPPAAAAAWSRAVRHRWLRVPTQALASTAGAHRAITWIEQHYGKEAPRATQEERRWLAGLLHHEVELLRALTGLAFHEWTDFKPTGGYVDDGAR